MYPIEWTEDQKQKLGALVNACKELVAQDRWGADVDINKAFDALLNASESYAQAIGYCQPDDRLHFLARPEALKHMGVA